MHILVIEDQAKLAGNIKGLLEHDHYAVTVASDGKDGFEKAMTQDIDLLILDLNLPGMDGYVICAMLRQSKKNMPILMLTARTKSQEVIHGLNIGADDYLPKPFDSDELLARVRTLLRRTSQTRQPKLTAGNVTMDTNSQEVWLGDHKIGLSPKEYALFEFLLRNKGAVQDRQTLIHHVWGGRDELMFSQTVEYALTSRKLPFQAR